MSKLMHGEWEGRIKHWMRTLKDDFYTPLGEIEWEMARTMEELSLEEAMSLPMEKVSPGLRWGHTHEYGWFKSRIVLPKEAKDGWIVLNLHPEGESTLFVNGRAFGTYRAGWLSNPHIFMVDNFLTTCGREGEVFDIAMETYAGHYFPEAPEGGCATGPVLPGSYTDPKEEGKRITLGTSSFGLWNEDAYQLFIDADTLLQLLGTLDETSLRAAKIAEALEKFTLEVDFEQDREERIRSYKRGREVLRPALEAKNGSMAPLFYAIGNSHLDLAWLWPMQETYRKTARTFAAQLRLLEMYPEYVYIQSQPASYEMCRIYYPELFERIKKAIKEGRWIADGAMWVEPDTNMPSGEALVRQLLYGIRYYRDVLGTEPSTLWLPDTFGYSAVLPQLLKKAGIDYLVTQKIFWSYNEGEQFPYHYFTWEGMDGSKVTSFLPTSYTYNTTPTSATRAWKTRTQQRDLEGFLFPYGYGDGGGGPARDHIEYVRRQADLQGSVRMVHGSPKEFFEAMDELGGPKASYRGELYFSAHRGTYTSQAKIKENNRKAEIALREMELWGSLAEKLGVRAFAKDKADAWWKEVLLNQFHDILPGSGIREIYEEAREKVGAVIEETRAETGKIMESLVESGEGVTVFNSLPFEREVCVKLPDGKEGFVRVPSMGSVSITDKTESKLDLGFEKARAYKGEGGFVLENAFLKACVSEKGEVVSVRKKAEDGTLLSAEYAAEPMNAFHLYKDVPRLFDAWDIDSNYKEQEVEGLKDYRVTVKKAEGTEAVLLLEASISCSTIRQEITLSAKGKRIDFVTHADWNEMHRLLKVAFPVTVYSDEVINEIQYGYVRRPVHRSRPYDQDRFEVCNHRYSALFAGAHGAAVLNDSKYGMSANENALELTLLRASTSPEMRADNGAHDFVYAFYPSEESFEESGTVREAMDLNIPAVCQKGYREEIRLFSVEAEKEGLGSVIADAVKLAEDGSGDLIVRLYESMRQHQEVKLITPYEVKEVYETDLLEARAGEDLSFAKEEKGCVIPLTFGPFEVKTLRLGLIAKKA